MTGGPVLLVLADSLAFHGPQRAEPADEPRLWPNVAATALGGGAELVAGIGWTARHAWQALCSGPRVWAIIPRVAAERATRAWAARSGAALLDLPASVGAHRAGGRGNPDGMHGGWSGHAAAGSACAGLLAPRLARAAGSSSG